MYIAVIVGFVTVFVAAMAWLVKYIGAKRRRLGEELSRALAEARGTLVLPPGKASFRGSTARWGKIKCDGAAFLTTERFCFMPLVGKNAVDLPVSEIREAKISDCFQNNWRGDTTVLVLTLVDSTQVGFMFADNQKWKQAFRQAAAGR